MSLGIDHARDHPAFGRWLRQSPSGRLLIDRSKIKAEQRLDGKYLITTSDPHISAEDTAVGYKSLLEAKRGFRTVHAHDVDPYVTHDPSAQR
jgi:hypothetical protein